MTFKTGAFNSPEIRVSDRSTLVNTKNTFDVLNDVETEAAIDVATVNTTFAPERAVPVQEMPKKGESLSKGIAGIPAKQHEIRLQAAGIADNLFDTVSHETGFTAVKHGEENGCAQNDAQAVSAVRVHCASTHCANGDIVHVPGEVNVAKLSNEAYNTGDVQVTPQSHAVTTSTTGNVPLIVSDTAHHEENGEENACAEFENNLVRNVTTARHEEQQSPHHVHFPESQRVQNSKAPVNDSVTVGAVSINGAPPIIALDEAYIGVSDMQGKAKKDEAVNSPAEAHFLDEEILTDTVQLPQVATESVPIAALVPGNSTAKNVQSDVESTKAWVMRSCGTPDKIPSTVLNQQLLPSRAICDEKHTTPEANSAKNKCRAVQKTKKKSRQNSVASTDEGNKGEVIQHVQQQTEEDIRKAKIRAWQDAILAKSYAEIPVIESNIEPLNVQENKATHSVPSQDSFDPSNAITMGRDNDDIENDRALTAYVSPAHSGNTLIPTATLEVICKQASKVMKEVGRGFFPVTTQDRIDTETQEAPTYYLGDLFEESQKDQKILSKEVKSKWNLDAPLFIPNALRQQETQVPVESVDSQDASAHEFPTGPSDEVLLQRLDLHDIRGLLHRQNSPPHDLPQKFLSPHPGIIEDGSEYEDEDEDSTAYNKMAEARYAGLSPRFEQACKPKLIKKKRRPLEPKKKEAAPKKSKRVQPTRSSKSRSSRRK